MTDRPVEPPLSARDGESAREGIAPSTHSPSTAYPTQHRSRLSGLSLTCPPTPDGRSTAELRTPTTAGNITEPPLSDELPETYLAQRAEKVFALRVALERNRARKAMTRPHPYFPVDPDPAA